MSTNTNPVTVRDLDSNRIRVGWAFPDSNGTWVGSSRDLEAACGAPAKGVPALRRKAALLVALKQLRDQAGAPVRPASGPVYPMVPAPVVIPSKVAAPAQLVLQAGPCRLDLQHELRDRFLVVAAARPCATVLALALAMYRACIARGDAPSSPLVRNIETVLAACTDYVPSYKEGRRRFEASFAPDHDAHVQARMVRTLREPAKVAAPVGTDFPASADVDAAIARATVLLPSGTRFQRVAMAYLLTRGWECVRAEVKTSSRGKVVVKWVTLTKGEADSRLFIGPRCIRRGRVWSQSTSITDAMLKRMAAAGYLPTV